MKQQSRFKALSQFGWFFALTSGLWLLFLLFQYLGFSANSSKGLSLLALLFIIAIGLVVQRQRAKLKWKRRFEGLSLEQGMQELDKVFEEQVAAGIITRRELDDLKTKAGAE